jgi:Uma2 family endonuclease
MPSATQIPVSEYLQSSYQPDCEYIDGEVRERNVGKWSHARVQWLLAAWFARHESLWNVIGSTEQRMQVSPTRIRVPDLVLLRPGPQPDVLNAPPLLIIEILSPDDSYSSLQERCQDYLAMGVETVWIIDPNTRSGRMCVDTDWIAAERLEVSGTPIHVHLNLLFAQIDIPSGSQPPNLDPA